MNTSMLEDAVLTLIIQHQLRKNLVTRFDCTGEQLIISMKRVEEQKEFSIYDVIRCLSVRVLVSF